jgi:hypothetical protein
MMNDTDGLLVWMTRSDNVQWLHYLLFLLQANDHANWIDIY